MNPPIRSIAVAAVALGLGLSPARAQHRLTSVAEYPPSPQHFLQSLSINDRGQISFMGPSDQTPVGVAGLFLSRPGASHASQRTALVPISSGFVDARSRGIDDSGRAVYISGAVFTTDGRRTRQVADAPEDEETLYHSAVINERGTVAFAADLDEDGNTALFLCPKGGEPIAISDSTTGPLNYHSPPALDGSDRVVFSAHDAAAPDAAIYLFDRGAVAKVADRGVAPCVSRNGTFAFTRPEQQPGATSILRSQIPPSGPKGKPTSLTPIADSNGPFTRVLADSINDRGQVAFRASLPSGGITVCIGDGRVITRILQTGDQVLGRTVANLSPPSINNSGELAVEATFTDGTAAVIRAERR